jgi:sugar lactone lactonase YvrE
MKSFFRSRRGKIFIVVFLALVLRLWAAFQLPLDYDEPVYLQNAFDYSNAIRAGNLNAVIDYTGTPEHPPLTRLLYSLTMLPMGTRFGWSDALVFGRLVSVFFGTLAVWVLALVDPLAGGLFAIQTYAIKYTSQAYLEALPLFASLAALFALRASKTRRDRWFWLSGVALGLTAAGKYSYVPIFFVILYVYFVDKKYSWKDLLLYLGTAALTFFILDPALWHDPFQRLYHSIFFHAQYAQGEHVQEVGYPWYQPFIWLSRSMPFEWHPGVFFFNPAEGPFSIDGLIFILALFGLVDQWRQRRYVVVWIGVSVLALLLWPTKWPQYILVVIPAFCLAATATFRKILGYFRHLEDYYGWVTTMIPLPSTAFWVVLILFVGFFGIFTAVNGVNMVQARQGWSQVVEDLSDLPSNQVYAVAPTSQGRMVIGTNQGAAIWQPASGDEVADHWQVFNTGNSALPDNDVLSLLSKPDGEIWFGTRTGLARYDGQSWQVFDAKTMGLPQAEIHDLQVGKDGRLWAATNSGAAVFDGQRWRAYTPDNSGLGDALVLSIAVMTGPNGEQVYFGTGNGLYRYDASTNTWESISPERFNRESGGITDLLVDSKGNLWVATRGSGLLKWDGANWRQYKVSNSEISSNRVDKIYEDPQGNLWIGVSYPDRPGGLLVRFDGQNWKVFAPKYTGYSGGSTVAIAQDALSRYWFGTQTLGLDIYDPPKEKNDSNEK